MGLDQGFALAKRAGLYISTIQTQPATEPADITFTVATSGGISAGDLAIDLTVASGSTTLPVGARLNFSGVEVIVTTQVTVTTSSTEVAIDAAFGEVGDGSPAAIAESATAAWDQLRWVRGTENVPFVVNGNEQRLSSTTYDSAEEASWDDGTILSANWQMNRSGNRKADDVAGGIIRALANEPSGELWVKVVRPREDNSVAEYIEGRAQIPNYQDDAPAPGILTESYTLSGRGKPKRTTVAAS